VLWRDVAPMPLSPRLIIFLGYQETGPGIEFAQGINI